MTCGTDYVGMWEALEFIDAVRCPFQNTMGPAFPLIAVLAVGFAFIVLADGEPVLPVVLLIVVGGVVMTLLPAGIVTSVVVMLTLVLVGGGYTLYKRAQGA
jgi:hypothetical protein